MLTQSGRSWLFIIIIITLTIGALVPTPLTAAKLQPGAAAGFTRYVQLTEERMQLELRPNGPFLGIDALTPERRREAETALRRGEIITDRIETRDPAGLVRLPGALIHHWVGLIFVPGASLDQVLRTVQDYDNHQRYYGPQVVKSKLLQRTGDDFKSLSSPQAGQGHHRGHGYRARGPLRASGQDPRAESRVRHPYRRGRTSRRKK
jgi:hypothetical protein